ncbi:hypothetical protein FACS1894211_09290 [Clostridia bacterium]|nr:hypothetical protein FACS1894211_09290 [Clostridia bacterium]
MKIEIVCRDYHADEKQTALFLKKLKRLDKYFGAETPARLALRTEGGQYGMELTVQGAQPARAEAESTDMNKNIDLIIPRITRQFRKEHTKTIAKREQ